MNFYLLHAGIIWSESKHQTCQNGRDQKYSHFPLLELSIYYALVVLNCNHFSMSDGNFTYPCERVCPLGIDIAAFVEFVKNGAFGEAFGKIVLDNPFPAVVGRVCPAPCEQECASANSGSPVPIRHLERFVGDHAYSHGLLLPAPKNELEISVGIVGAGATGLSAAYFLRQMGIQTTIYDSMPRPGGAMAYLIPSFLLPRDVLFYEIMRLEKIGVRFEDRVCLEKDFSLAEIRGKHDAVLLAAGCSKTELPKIPGRESADVMTAADFLKKYHSAALDIKISGATESVVVGEDRWAIFAARLLRRLGAGVKIVIKNSAQSLPPQVRKTLADERIEIMDSAAVTTIFSQGGKVVGLRCVRMSSTEGAFSSVPDSGFEIECDFVCFSARRQPDYSILGEAKDLLKFTPAGKLEVDSNFSTNIYGIFAAGEFVFGEMPVMYSMAQGKAAAISIAQFLDISPRAGMTRLAPHQYRSQNYALSPAPQETILYRHIQSCVGDFGEIALGFDEATAIEQARRCACTKKE